MNARDQSSHLAALLRNEREAMAEFLVALARFDDGKVWRELGHTSLFYYLHRELGLSAGAAQHRKVAVDLIQRFPAVEAALRQGHLCLSSVCELAKVVTPENVGEVLPRFFGLSRREAEGVVASIRPVPTVPERDVVTPVRAAALASGDCAPRLPPQPDVKALHPGEMEASSRGEPAPRPPAVAAPARPLDRERPLTAELSRFHITVSRDFMETLDRTKDALSHSHPRASTEEVLLACMQLMLAKKAKERGVVDRPLETLRPSKPDHVPAHVRRAAMERSGGRCEWVFANGERCGSMHKLECDHIVPKALGGPASIENIRVLCRGHNLLAARRVFGDALMDRFTSGHRRSAPATICPAAPVDHANAKERRTPG
jgi:hypothetical protein